VVTNLVLLGFASAHPEFPFKYAHLHKTLQQISPARALDLNLKAFTEDFNPLPTKPQGESTAMFQPEFEQLPQPELRKLQLERLKETLKRIEANSFYFDKIHRLRAGDVSSLEDICKFPLMTKDDLRDGYPYKYSCAEKSSFLRMHMSSGTTGTPIIIHDPQDLVQWGAIMARCYAAAGLTASDVIQITPSFGLFNGGFRFSLRS